MWCAFFALCDMFVSMEYSDSGFGFQNTRVCSCHCLILLALNSQDMIGVNRCIYSAKRLGLAACDFFFFFFSFVVVVVSHKSNAKITF